MRPPEVFAPFRHRDFRLFWMAQAISFVGNWMQQMALGWLVTELSPRATDLGLRYLLLAIPVLLLSLKAGALADRLEKRRILMVTQWVELVLSLGLAALIYFDQIALWHVFALSFLSGIAMAFEWPAAEALPAELVDRPEIARAVAVMEQLNHASRLAGPALAGVLVGRFGSGSPFLAKGLSVIIVIASLARMRSRVPREDARAGDAMSSRVPGLSATREVLTYIRSAPAMIALLILVTLLFGLVFPFIVVLMVYYVRHVLGSDDAAVVGALISLSAIGSVAAAIGLLWGSYASRRWWLVVGVLGSAAALSLMAIAPSILLAGVFCTLLAACVATLSGRIAQLGQDLIPDGMRGRLMSIVSMSYVAVVPAVGLLISWLADRFGFALIMILAAATFAVAAMIVLVWAWTPLAAQPWSAASSSTEPRSVAQTAE